MSGPFDQQAAPASTYPCGGCGARVQFAPGTNVLRCPYCGFQQEIAATGRQVREHEIGELATLPRKPVGMIAPYTLVCQGCAGRTQTTETAGLCQFCGSPLVVDATATGQIVPEAVLPFALDHNGVRTALKQWTSSRWFAPTALKKVVSTESAKGTYVPHWTFDSQTYSSYQGARGVYYYVTETYQDDEGRMQTRQVRRTQWYSAYGQVSRYFDDVLVPASVMLPYKDLDLLAPWPLTEAQPFQPQYLAGYHALRYDIEPEQGLEEAKSRMSRVIVDDCREDIGGDEQRVDHVDTNFADLKFKLMLLPVWVATYVYEGKTWRILVNARSGEIHGERPYSKVKIAIAVLLALIVVAVVVYFVVRNGGSHSTGHTTSGRTGHSRH